jgi:hypothetical protein
MDMNRMEPYGVPHDVGWAPCCVESGWTVGEILTGLQFMAVAQARQGLDGCGTRLAFENFTEK